MSRVLQLKTRTILISILILVFLSLIYLAILPSGSVIYAYTPGEKNSFWGNLSPHVRTAKTSSSSTQKVMGDPIYINLRTPRPFTSADIKILYKNTSDIDIIEAGVLVDKKAWRYKLEPVSNNFINVLSKTWHTKRKGDLLLLEKYPSPRTIEDFLENLPNREKIATYNHDLDIDYEPILKTYNISKKSIQVTIRDSFELYTYIRNNERIHFAFDIVDLNQNRDQDDVSVFLYYKDAIIGTYALDDDGVTDDTNKESVMRSMVIDLPKMPGGIYKLELKANDDILTNSITHAQSKLSFINKIWIGAQEENDTTVYSDGDSLSILTKNPQSLGLVDIDGQMLDVNETYKQFKQETPNPISRVTLSSGDMILVSNGVFSFDKSELINPAIERVDSSYNMENDQIEFILARYTMPKKINTWNQGEFTIDLTNAYREDGTYSFMISIPGLLADDNINDFVEIKKIEASLHGDSVGGIIKNFLHKIK